MNQKGKKILKTCSLSLLGISLAAMGSYIGYNISSIMIGYRNKYDVIYDLDFQVPDTKPIKRKLTNDIVLLNFSKNGKWYNKTEITSRDLYGYDLITSNAFENIPNKLNMIELPSSIMLDEHELNWPNVSQITIDIQENKPQLLLEINGILFSKNDLWWSAKTILNREKRQIITMPGYNQISKHDINKYQISKRFFNELVFRNVEKIIFDKTEIYPITVFSTDAFLNCNKLENYLMIKLSGQVIFHQNSFSNTNIVNFNLLTDINKTNIIFHKNSISYNAVLNEIKILIESRFSDIYFISNEDDFVFSNNDLLNKISIISKRPTNLKIHISERSLLINNQNKNIEINIQASYCEITNNLISGIYTNVVLNLFTNDKDGEWYIKKNALAGINSNQFRINTNLPKGFFDNSGLSNDQMAEINYVDLT